MDAALRALSASVVLALVLTAAWLFWPRTLGGGTTYVVTYGDSMAPGFDTGDLAILRNAGAYAVGDVVAYSSEALDTIVMHRIVAGDAAGFVTRGDSNDWLDEDEPSHDEILGRLFLRIPRGGIALDAITSPGALVFVVGGLLTVLARARRPRRRGRRGIGDVGRRVARRVPAFSVPAFPAPALSVPAFPVPAFSLPARASARQVAVGSGAVALVALVGGGVLLALPSTQVDTRTVQVIQRGQFSYDGTAVAGTTYPTGVIETGDPVWTRLAERLTVSFTDTVTGPELTELTGTVRLDVSVAAADGWSAVLTSGPVAVMENGTATASVAVDLAAATALVSRHYAEIGGTAGGATLTVTPVVAVTGRAEGRGFHADAPPGLPFSLDAASLRPAWSAESALAPITDTAVAVEEVVPRRLPLLAFPVPVEVARIAAAGVLAVALLVLGAGAWIGRTGRGDVAGRFLVRHADRILPIADFTPGPTVFDVADAESLHRVAERFDTVVLHHAGPDEDVFAVRNSDATYRFVISGTPGRRRGAPPVPGPAARPLQMPPAPASVPVPEGPPVPDRAGPPAPPPDPTVPLPRIPEQRQDPTPPVPTVVPGSTGRHWGRVA